MKLGSPSQTGHLWSYILPHGPIPPKTTHFFKIQLGIPKISVLFLSWTSFTNWALLQNLSFFSFHPLWSGSCFSLFLLFSILLEVSRYKGAICTGHREARNKVHTCRLACGWFLTRKGNSEILIKGHRVRVREEGVNSSRRTDKTCVLAIASVLFLNLSFAAGREEESE